MGFNEVGKVSVCMCTCVHHAYMFVSEHKPDTRLGASQTSLAAEKKPRSWKRFSVFVVPQFTYLKKGASW